MISAIYIEKELVGHARVQALCQRFKHVPVIVCDRYTEIFNRKSQNFRIQKKAPALILARKHGNFVLPAPSAYSIGAEYNYYFSHMLNCLYDCRYCFLQGMYQSANYLLFINYEDFKTSLIEKMEAHKQTSSCFYSGYDCDSLAFDPVSGFVEYFLGLFADYPNATLELRSKSTQIRSLLDREPLKNVVVAFSFTPAQVSQRWENKVPDLEKRIDAMLRLAQQGWRIGLRFDPLLYHTDYQAQYAALFDQVFEKLDPESVHSVSLGLFRLPEKFHKKMFRLYPQEALFAAGLNTTDKMVSYNAVIEKEMLAYCEQLLLQKIDKTVYFPCH